MAANLSAITLMGNPSWGYEHNLELIWIGLGAIFAAPLVIIIFASTYLKLNLFTAYEYLETRFNLQVRLLTSLLFQLLRCMHVAIAIYAPSLTLHLVLQLPFWECVLLMGLLTTVYTSIGGMKAVIYTDAIQFGIVMSGIALVFWTAISHAGGISPAYQIAMGAGRLRLFDFSPSPSRMTSFWACVIRRNRAFARSAGDRPGHSAAFTCDKISTRLQKVRLASSGLDRANRGMSLFDGHLSFCFLPSEPLASSWFDFRGCYLAFLRCSRTPFRHCGFHRRRDPSFIHGRDVCGNEICHHPDDR